VVKDQQKSEKKKEIVYNLLVAECHEYFANDILVHNCIAYLLCCYLIFEGQNLHLYGINKEDILSRINNDGQSIEEQERSNQIRIRSQMRDIEDKMKYCTSPFIRLSYERRLKELAELIDDKNLPVATISKEHMKQQIEEIDPRKNKFDLQMFDKMKHIL